jgi:hypothetical protein
MQIDQVSLDFMMLGQLDMRIPSVLVTQDNKSIRDNNEDILKVIFQVTCLTY